jgi:hypothetical protein
MSERPVEEHNLQIFWTGYVGQQWEKITQSPSFAAGNLACSTHHVPPTTPLSPS